MIHKSHKKKALLAALIVLLVLVFGSIATWYKMFREVPQPGWIAANKRSKFLYGSIGTEMSAGIPYWIWLVLPRLFPEYMPGPGGYASLGFPWEETREMPAGFSKKTVGYVRVAGNCAMCHASTHPNGPDEAPTVLAVGPGHTTEVQRLQRFYHQCAQDPRFTANDILDEVGMATKLSLLDRLLYRYILIPRTREQLTNSNSVMIDAALWRHSQNPHPDPAFQQRIEELEPALNGPEKDALIVYRRTLR
jgi:hypothetical protein